MQQSTGMEVREGCDLAVRLYAVAAQVCGLYAQADWVSRQCFPQTAVGEYLDHHAQMRGLSRKAATYAEGVIRFFVSSAAETDRIIPAGTVCMTADLIRFETTQEGILCAGELQVDIPAKAVEAGSYGNVVAGAVVSMAVAPVGVAGCSNPEAFSCGGDAEGDEELRVRILETFRRLPNGANAAFYQQGALSFDQVAAATVLPRARGQGTVDVVVSTLTGVPDEELLHQLQEYFQQRREIAVDVEVRAPETVLIDLAVQVKVAEGKAWDTVKGEVEQALTEWFTGKRLGQDVLKVQLGSLIYNCDGVENYSLSGPEADVEISDDQLPVLNSLSVEAIA